MNKIHVLLTLACLYNLSSWAQKNDLALRTETGFIFELNKKSNISFSYRLDLNENISQFRRSNFSLAYEQNINNWLDAELYYRYITNYSQDEHRFRIALSTDKKIFKKTRLKFRTLLQHDIEYFDVEYLSKYKPEYVWRNKLSIDKKINKRWSASIYTEPFLSFSYKTSAPYRQRSGTSITYEKKRWKFTAEYFLQNEFYFEQSNLHVLGISSRYDITRLLKVKKS